MLKWNGLELRRNDIEYLRFNIIMRYSGSGIAGKTSKFDAKLLLENLLNRNANIEYLEYKM